MDYNKYREEIMILHDKLKSTNKTEYMIANGRMCDMLTQKLPSLNLHNRILQLAKEHDTTIATIEKICGFGNGTIGRWKNSMPSIEKIIKVADFFNVGIDTLIGRNIDNANKIDYVKLEDVLSENTTLIFERPNDLTGEGNFMKLGNREKLLLLEIAKYIDMPDEGVKATRHWMNEVSEELKGD
ncbi:helix-turn-helix transcriptional regulator [Candidatus Enterococcus clewellii]|uniref:HTH cro/C1-type domain-containing protein n=1 Tax=Candidatus Enterococcus clewellii TaxID=1834193 RepID=A0AAQ3XZR9_9ENTE